MRTLLALAALVLMSPAVLAAGGVEETAQICAGCHGENGVPQEKTTPIIWGQNEGYIYLQLRDFKSGARKHEVMSQIAATLEKDDMKALAAHFTKLEWPDLQQPQAPKEVAAKALAANASIGCTGCHLGEFQGDGSTARLAGQSRAYLENTIADFRERSRGNNAGMSDLMRVTPMDDLAALAEYLAGLQILGTTTHR